VPQVRVICDRAHWASASFTWYKRKQTTKKKLKNEEDKKETEYLLPFSLKAISPFPLPLTLTSKNLV